MTQRYDGGRRYASMYGPRMAEATQYFAKGDNMPDYDINPTLDEGALDFLWLLANATNPDEQN